MIRPPTSRRDPQVDVLHGVRVPDPYRWLEATDGDEVRAWVEGQNAAARDFLDRIPHRAAIRRRLAEVWDCERRSTPIGAGGWYFFLRNTGLAQQATLCRSRRPDGAEPEVVLDPNRWSADGTSSLGAWDVTRDGRHLVYGVSEAGSDWTTFRVLDLQSLVETGDVVHRSKFTPPVWLADGSGFVYGAFPGDDESPPSGRPSAVLDLVGENRGHELRLHRLGTDESADTVVHRDEASADRTFYASVTDDGGLLVVHVSAASAERNGISVAEITGGTIGPTRPLFDRFDALYDVVGGIGRRLWFRTTAGADRGRVIAVDLDAPEPERWQEIVAEHETDTLLDVNLVGDRLFLLYLRDAASRVHQCSLDGADEGELALPGLGTAAGFSGRAGATETFYLFTSYARPATIYHHDLASGRSTAVHRASYAMDTDRLHTEQIFATSADGTRVPAFVSWYGELDRDGMRPTLLGGYGGFAIPQLPAFDIAAAVWMEMGGVFVVANLRGGGEYGREWHAAGTRERKQNVFDDFVAVAEHLIDQGITRPSRLGIHGRSNGGLLVGAVMTQRPELFGAALPAVGVLDMLRFHRFTIGWAWAGDYGTADDGEQFRTLLAYSPVHNARPAAYPPTLVTTGDHDDRVVPIHSFKFTAALQAAQRGMAPILARIETRAGHGAGKPTSMLVDERADQWAFLAWALGMKP